MLKEKSGVAFTLDKPIYSLFCTFRITILPKVLTRGDTARPRPSRPATPPRTPCEGMPPR